MENWIDFLCLICSQIQSRQTSKERGPSPNCLLESKAQISSQFYLNQYTLVTENQAQFIWKERSIHHGDKIFTTQVISRTIRNTMSSNSTDDSSFAFSPQTVPALVLMVFILPINGGVIFLIASYSSLRTPSNIILASLAVSDFLVGLVGIPLLLACTYTYISPICISSYTFFTFMALSTVLHITVMTCDRYIYIVWALRYRDIVHRKRVLIVLGITWFLSLTSLVRLSWTWNLNIETAREDLEPMHQKETTLFLFNVIVFFLIPLIIMSVLDTHMLLLLRSQCQRIARENLPTEFEKRERKLQRRRQRAVLTCVLLLTLYVIFWLPYFILEIVQQTHNDNLHPMTVFAIYYLRLCTSMFNPLAYTLRKRDLKSKVRYIAYNLFPKLAADTVENRTDQFPLSSRTDL